MLILFLSDQIKTRVAIKILIKDIKKSGTSASVVMAAVLKHEISVSMNHPEVRLQVALPSPSLRHDLASTSPPPIQSASCFQPLLLSLQKTAVLRTLTATMVNKTTTMELTRSSFISSIQGPHLLPPTQRSVYLIVNRMSLKLHPTFH